MSKDIKQLLELRKEKKSKKPTFIKQDAHKKPRVGKKWKRPRGIDSKIRQNIKGYRRGVSVGYKSPIAVSGLNKKGLLPILISNIKELNKLEKTDSAIIASNTGLKNKLAIIKECIKKEIMIDNIKDPQAFVKETEEKIAKRKQEKTSKKTKKEAKEKEKKKKAEEKESKEKEEKDKPEEKDELTKKIEEDDKKKKEKQEKDKVLATKT